MPAIRLPGLSWGTRRTRKSFADQECLIRRWSLRTGRISPRRVAWYMRFCRVNTFRWRRVHGSVFHPSIDRVTVCIACILRLVPVPSTLSGLRRHIPWLSQGRWLVRPSPCPPVYGGHLLPAQVLAALLRRERVGSYSVPGGCLVLHGGLDCPPGYFGMPPGSREDVSSLSPCPFWTKPIPHGGLSHITTVL
jgi:hypothetical protein